MAADEIVATSETLELVGDSYPTAETRRAPLKGFAEPVEVSTIAWR